MNLAILVGSGLIVVSIFTSLLSFRVGAPLLLVFLGIGLIAGEDGLIGIAFNDGPAAYFIGGVALAVILFDSGFGTPLQSYRVAAAPAIVLATVGVVLTNLLIAGVAIVFLGFDTLEALLMGAIIASTDAAAVFFLLRVGGIAIRERVRSTLEIESGSNDPMAIFLTILLVETIAAGAPTDGIDAGMLVILGRQAGLGLAFGFVGGVVIVQVANRVRLDPGLMPILVLGMALCLFAATAMLDGSGFLAVYVAGTVAGNSHLRNAAALRRYQNAATWFGQITMFLTLGLLATPSQFPDVAMPAAVVAVALAFLARPLAVWLCLLPFRFGKRETAFIAWVGLRGSVSILLGILPVVYGLPNGQMFFNMAFLIVLASLLVQGWTIRPLARALGLIVPRKIGPVDRVELELPGRSNHELVAYRVVPDSPVDKGTRIPRWARPSLVVRDGRSMDPHRAGRPRAGDRVYVFIAPERIPLLDHLFARPRPLDDNDRDFLGDFALAPDAPLAEVGAAYGVPVPDEARERTVAETLAFEFAGKPEPGDRMPFGGVELIVRAVDGDGVVTEAGLALEPVRAARGTSAALQALRRLATRPPLPWRKPPEADARTDTPADSPPSG